MPIYRSIDVSKENERRIAERLLKLKEAVEEVGIPEHNLQDTLLLATWNIREFDSTKYGERGREPLFYIAEIIDRFDLAAVQEVRDDLTALNELMNYLGGWWKYVLTDVTEGAPGNRVRMAFLYDSREIRFGGLAGEIVIPTTKKLEPAKQLARTPFVVSLQADWFKFTICTTHILYGKAVAEEPNRLEEIRVLAKSLADRAQEKFAWSKNMILLGDFNIFVPSDQMLKAITEAGFVVPKQLQKLPSNVPQDKHYDQIAFIAPEMRDQLELCRAGVFNQYNYVYRKDDEALYAEDMSKAYTETKEGKKRDEKARTTYYNTWRTFQMSDHLPMWIELKINLGKQYLEQKLGQS